MSNKDVERKAIDIVIKYERKQNRKPIDISDTRSGKGYDVASGIRKIEVKSFSGKLPSRVVLNYYNYEAFKRYKNFWLYLVYNLNSKKPELKILKKDDIDGEPYEQYEVKLDKHIANIEL